MNAGATILLGAMVFGGVIGQLCDDPPAPTTVPVAAPAYHAPAPVCVYPPFTPSPPIEALVPAQAPVVPVVAAAPVSEPRKPRQPAGPATTVTVKDTTTTSAKGAVTRSHSVTTRTTG